VVSDNHLYEPIQCEEAFSIKTQHIGESKINPVKDKMRKKKTVITFAKVMDDNDLARFACFLLQSDRSSTSSDKPHLPLFPSDPELQNITDHKPCRMQRTVRLLPPLTPNSCHINSNTNSNKKRSRTDLLKKTCNPQRTTQVSILSEAPQMRFRLSAFLLFFCVFLITAAFVVDVGGFCVE
jgi:hypothetical protein